MRRALVFLIAWTAIAEARDAHVTAVTTTSAYIDAGTSDGLTLDSTWQATINGHAMTVRIAAIASHTALIELGTASSLPVGTAIALPPGLTPPTPVVPPPPPIAMPAWRDDPTALAVVKQQTSNAQPSPPSQSTETEVSGEIALSALLAADTSNSSTSTQDLALSSQLSLASGPWQYDHLLEAQLVGSPEIFWAPLQHTQAQLNIYQLRLAYLPEGASYAAAIGRQTGAPLAELGTIDGARGQLALDR
jgi:hypothetical protein